MKIKKITARLLSSAMCLSLIGCSAGNNKTLQDGSEAEREAASASYDAVSSAGDADESGGSEMSEGSVLPLSTDFMYAVRKFSMDSVTSFISPDSEENLVYSPLCVYSVLAMAAEGAGYETFVELMNAAGLDDRSILRQQYDVLFSRLSGEECSIANSLWYTDKSDIKEDYKDILETYYHTDTFETDFSSSDSLQEWIEDATNGLIKSSVSLPEDTVTAIYDALYFKDGWQTPFADAGEDIFRSPSGNVTASYMERFDSNVYAKKTEDYKSAYVLTENGYRMVFVLPEDMTEFLSNQKDISEALECTDVDRYAVDWKIPKFSFGNETDMTKALQDLGVNLAFTEAADFSKMSDYPMYISSASSGAHIAIDEEGVEGASYAGFGMSFTSLPSERERLDMTLDSPFLFGVQNIDNGAWLFLGIVNDPTA